MMLLASVGTVFITLGIVTVSVLMIGLILLQKNRGAGLSGAFGGVGGHTAFGTKTGDFLTWVTVGLVSVFLLLNIVGNYVFEPTAIAPAVSPPPASPPPGPVPVQPIEMPMGQPPREMPGEPMPIRGTLDASPAGQTVEGQLPRQPPTEAGADGLTPQDQAPQSPAPRPVPTTQPS